MLGVSVGGRYTSAERWPVVPMCLSPSELRAIQQSPGLCTGLTAWPCFTCYKIFLIVRIKRVGVSPLLTRWP